MKSLSCLERFLAVDELLDRVENDDDLLVELFLLFQEDVPRSSTALKMAVVGSDMSAIEKGAHRLKGMLANLSATEAAFLAAGIESAARAGNRERIQEIMATFDTQLNAIVRALDSFLKEAKN